MNFYYTNYYRRAIEQHTTGLKLVLGGTGLGKTSSLAALLRSSEFPEDVKFIYVANRIQLLDEMAESVASLNIHVQQKQDAEHLRDIIKEGTLLTFIDHPETKLLVNEYNERNATLAIRLDSLRQKVGQFKKLERFSEEELGGLVDVPSFAWELTNPLKRLLSFANWLSEQTPSQGQLITQRQAAALAALPFWSSLFPFLRFENDSSLRLYLVTVQKAFRGVFDGRRSIRLGNWKTPSSGGRFVFIFDEFDFLENDLLDMLSEDKEVSDPFGLVRTFYERIKSQKLSHDDYLTQKPSWKSIRDELTEICDRVGILKTAHGIDFPDFTHFVTKDKAIRGRAIFQSNYSLVNQPVYLRDPTERPYSFDLTTNKKGRNKSAFVLLDVVSRAVKDIIRLFKRLETEHEDIYPELLRQCFGGTDYLHEIRRVKQIGWRHEWCETNYGYLLANGFGLFEIRANQSQLTDPEEVAVRYLSMNNSPEAMMREMCRVHLVFGLSATAHIHRTLRNFDWAGLAHPLTADDSFQPLPITTDDQADVDRANRVKAGVRASSIQFEVAETLSLDSLFGKQLDAMACRSDDVFGTNAQKGHRLRRAQHFFGLLSWLVAQESDVKRLKTHLVFLSSVRQISYLLGTIKDDEDGWFSATAKSLPTSLSALELYDLTYRDEATGRLFDGHVVLYDARFGQALRKEPALEAQYNALFWDDKPVIVVTTYPSAGNGVNLQYYLTQADYEAKRSAGKRDFINLHLLDSPYFYFGGTNREDSNADNLAAIKRDVYGVMKLLQAKQISEAQAVAELGHITRINSFNATYLSMPDGVLNQFSVFVQALGRIERVWQPTANQTLRLDREVYKVFERFVARDELASRRQHYWRFASSTMRSLLTAVEQHAEVHRDTVEDELLDISGANQQARLAIHQMVLDVQQFKRLGKPADIRQRWQRLREDVLKHNMQADSLKEIGGVFQTDYVQAGMLYMNRQTQIAPPDVHSHEFEAWNLNAVYHALTVIPNTALTNYFRVRGYELGFVDTGYFFLPYVYQSILTGAVGEEATLAILGMKGIQASGDTIPDSLFEVADLRVEDRPIFIDCKNYGARTLRNFALPPDDPLHHPALNEPHFKEKLVEKWQTINLAVSPTATEPVRRSDGLTEPCRLIIVNLVHDEEGALRYYDAQFEGVDSWDEARIIVLTGVLKRQPTEAKDILTIACNTLITNLKQ